MARKLRIWYKGAVYHVMCRGNNKRNIFMDSQDYMVFLAILHEAKIKFNFKILCYCLMTNHIHLHIKTSDEAIGKIMKKINMLYAIYFNQKYNLIGHLFQGRYRSELIDQDKYMLEISRYIHLNPVRANLVQTPEEYQWSSYKMYIGLRKETLIDTSLVLAYFNGKNPRDTYKSFVERVLLDDYGGGSDPQKDQRGFSAAGEE